MSRMLISGLAVGILAVAGPSFADDTAEPHATGGWVELGVESAGPSPLSDHLSIGGHTETFALGIELGGLLAAGNATAFIFDLGPTMRYTLLATDDRKTELVGIGTLRATLVLGDTGGPTTYTVLAGLDVRHWIDSHFAIGGGVLAHASSVSQDGSSSSDLGLAGAIHITGVF